MRLHLELIYDECDIDEYIKVLEKYGNVIYDDTISRDIIVWTLNYAIQKCFGWQNGHLHCFELAKDQSKNLISNNFSNYRTLVGVVFRTPCMDEDACFWQDDYESGSFKM